MKEEIMVMVTALAIMLTVLGLLFGQSKVATYFNLVDKRRYMGELQLHKMNAMLNAGEVRLSSATFMDEKNFYVYMDYKDGNAITSNSYRGKDINKVIDSAYEWSVERGFVVNQPNTTASN